jgi:hypothetical protein
LSTIGRKKEQLHRICMCTGCVLLLAMLEGLFERLAPCTPAGCVVDGVSVCRAAIVCCMLDTSMHW